MTKPPPFGVGGNEFDEEAKDVADIYNTRPILNSIKRQVLANLDARNTSFFMSRFL